MKKVSKAQIVQNYAKALFEAALSDKTLKTVAQDCNNMADTIKNIPELKILNNPNLKISQKQLMAKEIATKLQVCKTTENFLITLAEKNRFREINTILDKFRTIYYKSQNILEVFVQSVQPLTSAQQKHLQQEIIINYNINPNILGGLIIEYGSTRIDDSLKGKLSRLEQVMKGNA